MAQITVHSLVGDLTVFEEDEKIVSLDWGRAANTFGYGTQKGNATPVLKETARQLGAYFAGKLKSFDLPLDPLGTPFQKNVCKQMLAIPYGETRTYGDIAKNLNTSPRAVGNACGYNPIPVIVPCHRVLSGGGLGGYSGQGGLDTKQVLLRFEGVLLETSTQPNLI